MPLWRSSFLPLPPRLMSHALRVLEKRALSNPLNPASFSIHDAIFFCFIRSYDSIQNQREKSNLISSFNPSSSHSSSHNPSEIKLSELGNPIVKKWNKVNKKIFESEQHLNKILFLFHNFGLKVAKTAKIGDKFLQEEINYKLRNSFGHIGKYLANKILNKQKDPRLAFAFFRWAQTQPKFKPDVYIYTIVVRILGRSRNFPEMERFVDEMECLEDPNCFPNSATFNEVIKSYGMAGDIQKVNATFYRMKSSGIEPNIITYSTLLDIHSKLGMYEEALNVIRSMKLSQTKPDNVFYTCVISLYGKMGWVSKAEEIFRLMKPPGVLPNTQTYNTMLGVYLRSERKDEALKLFWKMINSKKKPNVVSFSVVVSACMEKGESYLIHLMEEMKKCEVAPDVIFYTEVISQCMKKGWFVMADEFLAEMKRRDVLPNDITYIVMAIEYSKNKNWKRARELMEEMRRKKLLPSLKLYVHFLQSLVESEDQSLIEGLWVLMEETGHSIHGLIPLLYNDDVLKTESSLNQLRIYLEILRTEEEMMTGTFIDTVTRLLVKSRLNDVAHKLWEEQRRFNFIRKINQSKKKWEMDLHDFSAEMALIAIKHELLNLKNMHLGLHSVYKNHVNDDICVKNGGNDGFVMLPETYCIITGWGKNSPLKGASPVKTEVEKFLGSLQSPFRVLEENSGRFLCDRNDLLVWLAKPNVVLKMKTHDLILD